MNGSLHIEDLTKTFGPVAVLNGVSLSLDAGQTLALKIGRAHV